MDLTKNQILYADMLNAMRHNADILYEDEGSILMCDKYSKIYYCAALSKAYADKMVPYLPKQFDILVSHDTYSNEAISEKTGITYENRCYHCAYLKQEPLPYVIPKGYKLKKIYEEYMDDVIAMYKKEMSELATPEYMRLCMEGGMLGILHNDELCGFISVHEGGYGSIGMLEVKENYRRKGFGVILERAMINEQLVHHNIPYGEIFVDNTASLKLQAKAGMEVGNDITYWFYN